MDAGASITVYPKLKLAGKEHAINISVLEGELTSDKGGNRGRISVHKELKLLAFENT